MRKMRNDERGMVSIIVTMIMILVITLIVLGFAQVTRRNQREALDNQLSTQAYYAAESGVNAAVNYLTNALYSSTQVNTIGQCQTFIGTLNGAGVSNTLDTSGTKTQYTCLMVNNEPSTLVVSPLTQTSSTILHLANADSAPNNQFTALKFQWSQQSPVGSTGPCSSSGSTGLKLPSYKAWDCPYGLLRLDLVDTTAANISNAALDNSQREVSFYMIPSYTTGSNTATVSWPPVSQPVSPSAAPTTPACTNANNNCPVRILPVACTATGTCSMEIKFTGGGSTDFYARLGMLYQNSSNLTVTGWDTAHPISGPGVAFVGGQALIDSTGQSQDELRRIQVRIPLDTSATSLPGYGLQTTDTICKQISDGTGVPFADACPGHP